MKTNMELSSCTFPVQYTNDRLDVTSLMREQAQRVSDEIDRQSAMGIKEILLDDFTVIFMSSLLCNIKHILWNYEKEFRCTTDATAKGVPFIEVTAKEIFIGMNCAPSDADRLMEISDIRNILVHKRGFDECCESYALVIKE